MLQRLKERGLKICVWINPYIAQRSPLFDEGHATRATCSSARTARCGSGTTGSRAWRIVDFTNPAACDWFAGQAAARCCDMGVDCFKTDFGERIPTDVRLPRRLRPAEDAQLLRLSVQRDGLRACWKQKLRRRRGGALRALGHRRRTAVPGALGRRLHATFESMAESLRGGLSLGLSGFGFWSHDIGGFEAHRACRRLQALVRLRPALLAQPPARQQFLPRALAVSTTKPCDVLRLFTKLKCRLMPYLYRQAAFAAESARR